MSGIATQETIDWIAVADEMPDSDTTVLVYAPGADEPIWLGYYDDIFWFAVDGATYGDVDEIAAEVTHWAMPKGPTP